MPQLDLAQPAENGLRRGFTTGSAATAALSAALLLLRGKAHSEVDISLPDAPGWTLRIPVAAARLLGAGAAYAEVVKDGGDDPDATHRAVIWVEVRPGSGPDMEFCAGAGVGTVTRPGLSVGVGEAAINPVPRRMLRAAALAIAGHARFRVTVGCVNGEAIARKTFNPRLGIVGGISILGTTGVVEPMSLSAYAASVRVYARFAVHSGAERVVFTPGKLGRDYAGAALGVARAEMVQISNFVGDALDALQEALAEAGRRLPLLLVAGHPGKLAKVLNGDWNTHSAHSGMAMNALARVARGCGLDPVAVQALDTANTVDAYVDVLRGHPHGAAVWAGAAAQIARAMHGRAPGVERLEVALFALDGSFLAREAA